MSFYLYMKQEGEGCDYTIGCGNSLTKLKETMIDLAQEEALEIIREATHSECTIEKAYIVEVVSDLSEHSRFHIPQEKANEEAKRERQAKLEQLENLKRELGVK